jgi:hypothetical protein
MPDRSGGPVVTYSCAFVFHTRGCGCMGHPAFPTPSGAELLMTKLARMRRDRKAVSLNLGCLKMDSAHPRLVPSPLCGGGPGRGVAASAPLVWNVHREGTTTRVGPSPQPSPTKGGGSAPPLWRQQHSNRSRKTKLFRYLRAKRCRWLASKPCASVSSNRLKKDRREQGGMT